MVVAARRPFQSSSRYSQFMTASTISRAAASHGFAPSTTRGLKVVGVSRISTSAPRCFHEKRSSLCGRKNCLSERRGMPGPRTSSAASPTSRYSRLP